MSKPFVLPIAILMAIFWTVSAAALAPEELYSGAAVLMDAETGQVLFEKNMRERTYPASTTKIMTALLVVENCDPAEIMTVYDSALDIDEWDSANIGLVPGEQLTVEDALCALMLASANEAANALAEHVAGSQQAFARMMTERAHEIGAVDTNFTNAHGLHDSQHYTTPYDMALITRHASQNRDFLRYFGASAHVIPPTNLHMEPRKLQNYQYMLVPDSEFYDPSVMGGKIGYTTPAMHTMSTFAKKYGIELIGVVMQSARNEKFYDTQTLLRFGFYQFRRLTLPANAFQTDPTPILEGDVQSASVRFRSNDDFTFLLHNSLNLSDVYVDYRLPESFAHGDDLPSSVGVRVGGADGGLPSLLGEHPVEAVIKADISAAAAFGRTANPRENALPRTGLWAAAAAVMILLIRAGITLYRRCAARKRRMRRMTRLMRERNLKRF